jgi:pyruvate/2-oxoglutarate dehydrogenase complex dihydrolipoamide acyltransferase (E2) component
VAPSSARRRRGTFAAFRRPFVTDPVFWIAALLAVAIGVAISAVLVALGGSVPDSVLAWSVATLIFVIAGWLSFKLLAMGLNTSRALEEAAVADETRAASMENKGRSAGAVAGRGAAALMKRGRKRSSSTAGAAKASSTPAPAADPTPQPAPAPTAEAAPPDVTVDKAARVLGSMVGRRLAERRKDDE